MGFLIYKKSNAGQTVLYERVKPLKLGGRDGLIARYVKTLPTDETPSWKLRVDALLKLAGMPAPDHQLAVLFDVAGPDTTNVCLYELSRIQGSCRDTSTQLALEFSVVVDQEIGDDAATFTRKFQITPPVQLKLLSEILGLTGGLGGGDWKWSAPSMQLGATVVQAQRSPAAASPCVDYL